MEDANGLVGDEVEKGFAHGSDDGSEGVVDHVGFWIVDWDRMLAKSASSSMMLVGGMYGIVERVDSRLEDKAVHPRSMTRTRQTRGPAVPSWL